MDAIDGNEAATHVAYGMSEFCFIYPITPSSPMSERADAWSGMGKKNIFGTVPVVNQMQSEAGAAGALHGCGAAGGLASSFTSCQGLLLMIPTLYKLSGEQIPCVLHVAARQVGCAGTSIYCDHTDVMSVRMCGLAQLSSGSVQESMDMAAVAHVSALRASMPFMHFFDGFQTSHSVASCELIPYEKLRTLVADEDVARFRATSLDPAHPHQRGTIVTRGDWMQMFESANSIYSEGIVNAVEKSMADIAAITGRKYGLFDYAGAADAEYAVVAIGTGALTAEECVDEMVANEGAKVGVVRVHLFRPWSPKHFLAALPKTVKRIAVLDRTKEPGSNGEPLFLDVLTTIVESADRAGVMVTGGRYGLADKAFTPAMVRSVFADLASANPHRRFVVGIDDDMTKLSLPVVPAPAPKASRTTQVTMWGMGSDGTVGAAQMAIKLITGDKHDGNKVYAQGQFHFTAHKSGGVTMSYLRFGPEAIKAAYPITHADYMAVHHPSYVGRYNAIIDSCKPGAVMLINAPWAPNAEALEKRIPAAWRRKIAQLGLKLYVVDALKISRSVGLGGHFNLVLLTAFFKLSGVLPVERAIPMLKETTRKQYAKKGDAIIKMNMDAIDQSLAALNTVDYPQKEWLNAVDPAVESAAAAAVAGVDVAFERDIKAPLMRFEGDVVPVSTFGAMLPAGRAPTTTTRMEKRNVATEIPVWVPDKCVQCNFCSFSCPHAVIRPFLLNESEVAAAPSGMSFLPASGPQGAGYKFRIQVSAMDCIGCGVCAAICPTKSLKMTPNEEVVPTESVNWEYCFNKVPSRPGLYPTDTARGSQFQQPLFEFCGACGGCGEAPYIKLLTQMFGERAICACASGCNVAYSFALGSNPYCTNPEGRGPASAHSLFEDTAEFGFGIARTRRIRRSLFAETVKKTLALPDAAGASKELSTGLGSWVADMTNGAASEVHRKALYPLLEAERSKNAHLTELYQLRELLTKASVWCIGGDGWSCDIDYGGIDHVLAQNEDMKMLVLDTEVYSNTGGQKSKGTPMGSVHKFEAAGKSSHKKDLGAIFMGFGNIYVASVCLYANQAQCLRAFAEAEAYPGPALILAYAPCIEHGIEGSGAGWVAQAKRAVDSGYWPLYRFNPALKAQGKNPFVLDAPTKVKATVAEFISHENRFQRLVRENKPRSEILHKELQDHTTERLQKLVALSQAKPAEAAPAPADTKQ